MFRRGKKFSLPAPKGGKHSVNPILAVDQPESQQRISKKALARNNPLDPDYVSGSSPFVVKERREKLMNFTVWFEHICRSILLLLRSIGNRGS
jgi:hypothetical protein